jgi:hypothetical protein
MNVKHLVDIVIKAQNLASKELKAISEDTTRFEKNVLALSTAVTAQSAATVTALVKMTLSAAEFANELQNVSQKALVSTDTLTAIGLEIERSGGEFRDAQMPIRRFSEAVVALASGNASMSASFARLGISVSDVIGPGGKLRTFDELLPLVAKGFANLSDNVSRVSLAVDLFGRSGVTLIPVLSDGVDGIRRMSQEARHLGLAIGDEAMGAVAQLSDDVITMKLTFKALEVAIAQGIVPGMRKLVNGLTEVMAGAGAVARSAPEVTGAFGMITASIAGAAGLVAALLALKRFWLWLKPMMSTGALAFSGLAVAITAAAMALMHMIGSQQVANERLKESQREANLVLKDTNATIEEQIKALERLRDAKMRAADANPIQGFQTDFGQPRATLNTGAEFDASAQGKLLQRLKGEQAKRRLGLSMDGKFPGMLTMPKEAEQIPAINARVPFKVDLDVEVEAVDLRSIEMQIEKQKMVVEAKTREAARLQKEFDLRTKPGQDLRDTMPAEMEKLYQDAADAAQAVLSAQQRLEALEERRAEALRTTAEKTKAVTLALIELNLEAGKTTLEEAAAAAGKEVARLRAEMEAAVKAQQSISVGAAGYTDATEKALSAVAALNAGVSLLNQIMGQMSSRNETAATETRDYAKATEELAAAQRALALVSDPSKSPVQIRATMDMEALRALQAEVERTRQAMIQEPNRPEIVQAHADATMNLASALMSQREAQEQTKESLSGLSMMMGGISALTAAAFDAITGTAVNMGSVVKSILLGIINSLIQMKIQAMAAQKVLSAMKMMSAMAGPAGIIGIVGSFVGVPLASGGEIMSGTRGLDTVPAFMQKGETVISPGLTDDLREFLRFARAGGGSGVGGVTLEQHVNINAGMMLGTEQDAQRMASTIVMRTDDFTRTNIARSTLKDA